MRLAFIIWLSGLLGSAAAHPSGQTTFADLPVTFEPNHGQWSSGVEFGAHIGGHEYTFKEKEITVWIIVDFRQLTAIDVMGVGDNQTLPCLPMDFAQLCDGRDFRGNDVLEHSAWSYRRQLIAVSHQQER